MRDWKLLWLTNVRYRDHDITAHGERPGADHDYSHEFDYDELHRLIEAKRGDAIGAASALVWGEISDRAYGNTIGYTGHRFDAETERYHMRFRVYVPVLGRFMQTDPAGYVDGMNLFSYVTENPVIFTDPFGLSGSANPAALKAWFIAKTMQMTIANAVRFGLRHGLEKEFIANALGISVATVLVIQAAE